jgi:hypothetical protein
MRIHRRNPLAAAALAFVGLSLLGASCEPPRSKNPIGDPKKAVADSHLIGTWGGRTDDNSKSTLTFLPREGGLVDLVLVGNDDTKGAVVLAFEAVPAKVGNKSYFSLRSKTYADDYAGTVKVSDDYIFVRYELSKSGAMTIALMDEANVETAVKSGALEGSALEGKPVMLTASSEKLAAFVSSPAGDKAYKPFGVFKKANINYPAPDPSKAP